MILQNAIFANGIGNTMKRLGGECRAFRHRAEGFVSQAPLRLIFSSPLLRKFFRVRETCLSHKDMMYSLTTDGRMFRLRWLGFVNACVDYDGSLYDFSLNRGRTPSEVKAHFRWAILPSYERDDDWRESLYWQLRNVSARQEEDEEDYGSEHAVRPRKLEACTEIVYCRWAEEDGEDGCDDFGDVEIPF